MLDALVCLVVGGALLFMILDQLKRRLKIGFGLSFLLIPTDKLPEFLDPPK